MSFQFVAQLADRSTLLCYKLDANVKWIYLDSKWKIPWNTLREVSALFVTSVRAVHWQTTDRYYCWKKNTVKSVLDLQPPLCNILSSCLNLLTKQHHQFFFFFFFFDEVINPLTNTAVNKPSPQPRPPQVPTHTAAALGPCTVSLIRLWGRCMMSPAALATNDVSH